MSTEIQSVTTPLEKLQQALVQKLEKGGLVVYDKEAPQEWNFAAYNSEENTPKILEWLNQSGAQAIRIPYRANRAVVFNSDLFHETDDIAFKDDFRSRRINITLLYGHRHHS